MAIKQLTTSLMIYAVKKSNESVDRLINRFKKQVQQSRLIMKVRNSKFRKKKKTRREVRNAAKMREHYRAQRRKMQYYS